MNVNCSLQQVINVTRWIGVLEAGLVASHVAKRRDPFEQL